MFIVADELAGGVGRQGGLSGAGQAEEHSGLMGLRVHVGRAVHGQDALLGQHVVHGGEYALLDFAGILGAADDDEVGLVVNHNGSLRVNAVYGGVALKAGGSDDGVVCFAVGGQLFAGGTDQQIVDEQVLGGQLIHNPELFGIFGVSAGKAVEDKDLPALEVGADLGQKWRRSVLWQWDG